MIHRFLYHAFWNFYDGLGVLLLCGIIHMITAFGVFACSIPLARLTVDQVVIGSGVVLLQILLLAFVLSALLPYCARIARNDSAGWRHLWAGFANLSRISLILILWVIIMAVLLANFVLYLKMQAQITTPVYKFILIIINAIIGWTFIAVFIFLAPWLSAATYSPGKITIRDATYDAFRVLMLLPGTWIFLWILSTVLLIVGVYTKIGMILYVPVMASFCHTAFHLSTLHMSYLTNAKDELGPGKPLRTYKTYAATMALQWEHHQPRRTLKELIRPWEY